MPPPSPADQIQFLTNLQRLLAEGLFTATYKYALLAALADLSVELGDDSGDPFTISHYAIAEKIVEYYWRHATPYAAGLAARVLRQSSGSQARILRLVAEAREKHGNSIAAMMRMPLEWERTREERGANTSRSTPLEVADCWARKSRFPLWTERDRRNRAPTRYCVLFSAVLFLSARSSPVCVA